MANWYTPGIITAFSYAVFWLNLDHSVECGVEIFQGAYGEVVRFSSFILGEVNI